MNRQTPAQWLLVSLGSNADHWQAYFEWAHRRLAPVAVGAAICNRDRYGGPIAYWNQLLVIPAQVVPDAAAIAHHCGARQAGVMPLDIDVLAERGIQTWSGDGWHWNDRRLPLPADVALGLESLWPEHYQASAEQRAQWIETRVWHPTASTQTAPAQKTKAG